MALRKLSKVLAQTASRNPFAFGARMISGKAMREIDPNKPKPFPYEKGVDYVRFPGMFEKTTLRFDENSKLIVVMVLTLLVNLILPKNWQMSWKWPTFHTLVWITY